MKECIEEQVFIVEQIFLTIAQGDAPIGSQNATTPVMQAIIDRFQSIFYDTAFRSFPL